MIIVEDTRNKLDKHILVNENLTKMGYQVIRSKLIVGDYTRLDNQTKCIDTKKDILELIHDVASQDHQRFINECKLANQVNIQLIVLIEELPPYRSLKQWLSPVKKDGNPITTVKGEVLEKILVTISKRYGVRFIFCDKRDTAGMIARLLSEEVHDASKSRKV